MYSKLDIEKYFLAEKQESIVFIVIGALAISAAVFLFFYQQTPAIRGMVIPLLAVGIIECVVGINVYSKSDAQRSDVIYACDMNPTKIRNQEVPRMEAVMRQFAVLRWTEILLFMVGAVLCYANRTTQVESFWFGFGVALSAQALIALILDFFAHRRGVDYLQGIQELIP